MNRRSFLQSILAASASGCAFSAPAIVRAESLMPIWQRNRDLIVPAYTRFYKTGSISPNPRMPGSFMVCADIELIVFPDDRIEILDGLSYLDIAKRLEYANS